MSKFIVAEIKVSYKPRIKPSDRVKVLCSNDAYRQIKPFFDQSMINIREEAVVLFLNRANQVIGGFKLSSGGITSTVIDISLILGIGLKCLAKGLILAHNHPSGELHPSKTDLDLTARFKEAAGLLDIKVIEHLIVTKDSYLSFTDEGLL